MTRDEPFFARGSEVRPMPEAARSEIAPRLIKLFDLLAQFTNQLGAEAPANGSRAAALISSDDLGGDLTQQLGTDFAVSVFVTSLSAFDHGGQVGRALGDGSGVSSLATLARGSLEAMGRVHWLVSANSPREAAGRWLSLQHSEHSLRLRLQPDGQVIGDNGEHTSLASRVGAIERHLRQIGYGRAIPVSFTGIATELAEIAHSNGRLLYSSMSGVAHAEQTALWHYIGVRDSLQYFWHLSADAGLEAAEMVYYPLGFFLKELLLWAGRSKVKPDEPWAVLHDELHNVLVRWREEFGK